MVNGIVSVVPLSLDTAAPHPPFSQINYCNQIQSPACKLWLPDDHRMLPQLHLNYYPQSNLSYHWMKEKCNFNDCKRTKWKVSLCGLLCIPEPTLHQRPGCDGSSRHPLYSWAFTPRSLSASESKDTWVKVSLVTKEVDKLGAIIKVACR